MTACVDGVPVWAIMTVLVLVFSLGFEGGRAYSWLYLLYTHNKRSD